ncbi:TPA: hypothetical protein ACH3X1_008224 [Trebouxia sp. C0004]
MEGAKINSKGAAQSIIVACCLLGPSFPQTVLIDHLWEAARVLFVGDLPLDLVGQSEFLPHSVTPEVERWLQAAENNWAFDIFGYSDATPGYSLSLLVWHFVKRAGLIKELSIDEGKFCAFARRIEAGYNPSNPYHNSVHVASVVQMTHMLMCHGGVLASQALTQRQQMATYFSALVHDFEHGGVNNDFLIKTSHPLAITYNDQSPLENHHHAAAVRVQVQPEHRYIPLITQRLLEDQAEIRSMCISQVLGTDMKKHFDITSRFQAAFKRPGGNEGTTSQGAGPAAPRCGVDWDGVKAEDKTLVHQVLSPCPSPASPHDHCIAEEHLHLQTTIVIVLHIEESQVMTVDTPELHGHTLEFSSVLLPPHLTTLPCGRTRMEPPPFCPVGNVQLAT